MRPPNALDALPSIRPAMTRFTRRAGLAAGLCLAMLVGRLLSAAPAGAVPLYFVGHKIADGFTSAWSVYAADLDGDGDMDVLGAAFLKHEVAWWQNAGGSETSFTERVIDDNFRGAHSVYAIDVDGDGDIDVLGAGNEADDIAWWENQGGGATHWAKHTVHESFDGARCVYATDLDGDGDVDLLGTAYDADDLTWWENDGNESFSAHTIDGEFDGAWWVRAADLDGDGDIDLLGSAYVENSVIWWENDGSQSFAPHVITDTFAGAAGLHATDVDADGDMDIAGVAREDDEVVWWENQGGAPPSFVEHTISSSFDHAISVYAADLDRDGDTDVLGAAYEGNEIAWWENDGSQNFAEHTIDGDSNGAMSVFAEDLDGDGDADVLGAEANESAIRWWENYVGPAPLLLEHPIETDFAGATSVYVVDMDLDEDQDVIGAAYDGGGVAWWENDGSIPPTFAMHPVGTAAALGPRSVYAVDLDGDEDLDVLCADAGQHRIRWWENNPTGNDPPADPFSWTAHTADEPVGGAYSVHAGDLDDDGDVDIVDSSSWVAWLENDGSTPPEFAHHTIIAGSTDCKAVYAADMDADGPLDILSGCSDQFWLENYDVAASNFRYHVVEEDTWWIHSVLAADMDGDDDKDQLVALREGGIRWYENSPSGNPPPMDPMSWAPHSLCAYSEGVTGIDAADLDGDGDMDILGASYAQAELVWWQNDGDEAFSHQFIHDEVRGASAVVGADVDGDGDTDVVSAAKMAGDVTWWENVRDFSISGPTAPQSVMPGSSASIDIDLSNDDPRTFVAVSLGTRGWPQGISADFSANPITPTASTIMTVTTDLSTPAGAHDLEVVGVAPPLSHTLVISLQVQGFSINSSAPPRVVAPGGQATFDIQVSDIHGFSVPVSLTVDDLPAGAAASFVPAAVVPSETAMLTVATAAHTPRRCL